MILEHGKKYLIVTKVLNNQFETMHIDFSLE